MGVQIWVKGRLFSQEFHSIVENKHKLQESLEGNYVVTETYY